MCRFLFFYANVIVNKNEVLNKVKLKLKLNLGYTSTMQVVRYTSSGWDASPSQGYLPPALNLPVPIYTPEWRGTVRVKCLDQEHNTMLLHWP